MLNSHNNTPASSIGSIHKSLRNSYKMGCPPVRGDHARALASELSYVQEDKHAITILYHPHQCIPCYTMLYLFYTTHISVYLAHHDKCHAEVGKGGIKSLCCVHTHSMNVDKDQPFTDWGKACLSREFSTSQIRL